MKDNRNGEKNNEENKTGDKKKETKETKEQQDKAIKYSESGRKTVSQGELMELWEVMKEMNENMDKRFQEWNSQVGADRKLVEKEGESKGKSEERSQETAGGQKQRTGRNVAMTQQRVRNADKAVNQRVETRVQNQQIGDCAWEKGK